jgi:hypothetical protein
VEALLAAIGSECGTVSTLLLAGLIAEILVIKLLWDRIKILEDKLLEVIENNTRAVTELIKELEDR